MVPIEQLFEYIPDEKSSDKDIRLILILKMSQKLWAQIRHKIGTIWAQKRKNLIKEFSPIQKKQIICLYFNR